MENGEIKKKRKFKNKSKTYNFNNSIKLMLPREVQNALIFSQINLNKYSLKHSLIKTLF